MATLTDQYGRPITTAQLKRELSAPTTMGVRNAANFPSMAVALTPEKLANIIRAVDAGNADPYLTLAEEMEEKETHYASVLGTRKDTIASLQLVVESFSDDAKDVAIADEVRNMLTTDAASDLVFDLADALGKGYSVCEIMWETTAKQWFPAQFKWRDPRYFMFDLLTRSELRLRDEGGLDIPMAPGKFVVHYPRIKTGLPIRGGLARLCAIAYMIKGYTLKDWLAFAEVFGLPLRVGKYAPGAKPEDIETLLRAVSNIGTDAAGIIPNTMSIDFEQPANQTGGAVLFKNMADWINGEMSKAVLGQTMTTEDGSSRAQAEVHDAVRKDIRDKDAKQMAATIKRDVVCTYVDLNHGKPTVRGGYPKVRLQVEESEDLERLAKAVTPFIDRGLRVSESEIRDKFGLAEPEADDVVLQPSTRLTAKEDNGDEGDDEGNDDPGQGDGVAGGRGTVPRTRNRGGPEDAAETARRKALTAAYERVSAGRSLTNDQRALIIAAEARPLDAIDADVQSALKDWQEMMGPIVTPIEELARSAESTEDFIDGLHDLVGRLGIGELTEQLAQWGFIERGRGNATDDV